MVTEKIFNGTLAIMVLFKHMTLLGSGQFGPRGLIGRIYVGDHLTLLHTEYISYGPHGFREEDILSFSHYKSMGANDPWGSLDTRGLTGRIYVGVLNIALYLCC